MQNRFCCTPSKFLLLLLLLLCKGKRSSGIQSRYLLFHQPIVDNFEFGLLENHSSLSISIRPGVLGNLIHASWAKSARNSYDFGNS